MSDFFPDLARRSEAAWLTCLLVGAALLVPARSWAITYSYTVVADSTGPHREVGASGPVINRFGEVAFKAGLDGDGGVGLFRGPNVATDTIADESGPFSSILSGVFSINDAGVVAFRASLGAGGTGVFIGPDPATDTFVDDSGPFAMFSGLGTGPSINNSGVVAFHADLDGGGEGIFVGPNPATDTIVDNSGMFAGFGSPSLNDPGDVVFRADLDTGGEGVFRYTAATSSTTLIADDAGPYDGLQGDPVQNNAGAVAFRASLATGGSGIFTGPDPSTDTVVDTTSGPFFVVLHPSINSAGTVAFSAFLPGNGRGIFTGPDPLYDAVIRSGQPLLGSVITFPLVAGHLEGINDVGQIVFSFRLDNGVQGVAVATPGNIDLVSTEGDWQVDSKHVIALDDPEAHFDFETLVVQETATDTESFDLEIMVEDFGLLGEREIAIDKRILNELGFATSKMRFVLGVGTGNNFVESTLGDDLFFVTKPAPQETTGAFPDLELNHNTLPDMLTFTGDLADGSTASFWLGIHVPDDLDGVVDRVATFTLRQITVPEPASHLLLAVPFALGWLSRRA